MYIFHGKNLRLFEYSCIKINQAGFDRKDVEMLKNSYNLIETFSVHLRLIYKFLRLQRYSCGDYTSVFVIDSNLPVQ
jgi:Holliday junction resolvasome RuvABC ATP-dependent DNA helicase subunit